MAWCQDTLAWYVDNSGNAALKARFADGVSSGRNLGGTGLSNPMKTFFGIENLKLKGRKVDGGYIVKGALPWVSNLGPDHIFGTIFESEGSARAKIVMFLADCGDPAITLHACPPFLAMDGTGTYAVQFRDAFVPDRSDPRRAARCRSSRASAPASCCCRPAWRLGLMRDCIAIMNEVAAAARPRQPLPRRSSRRISSDLLDRARNGGDDAGARPLRSGRPATGTRRDQASPASSAKPASRPRMRRCCIAARAAISRAIARSAGCARPISSPSSRRRPSN